jgi:RNA polymerase sigma factor (sigma-70 family)
MQSIVSKQAQQRRRRAGELEGMMLWMMENREDNSQRMAHLTRLLRIAREKELTDRQRQAVELYFDRGFRLKEIAAEMAVSPSTASRTLHRAKERLRRALQYAL